MDQPTHDLSVCVWKAGKWVCLHPIDADHFWLGDLMVDLVSLRYQLESLNAQSASHQWWDVHERNRVFGNLHRRAESLAKGKEQSADVVQYVKSNLLTANKHGLHTGYSE